MKKLIFLFALAFFASCETAIENLAISVTMPIVNIATPQVAKGTWIINREISTDSLNEIVKAQTGKSLDEVTDIVLEGVTVSIITPDTLTFSKFSYGKLVVSSSTSSVTVFDRQLNETGRTIAETNLNANVKNVIREARQGNKILTYTLTVTTTSNVPSATWKIETKAVVTP